MYLKPFLGRNSHHNDPAFGRSQDSCNERQGRRIQRSHGLGSIHGRSGSVGFLQGLCASLREARTTHHSDFHLLGTTASQFRNTSRGQKLTTRIICSQRKSSNLPKPQIHKMKFRCWALRTLATCILKLKLNFKIDSILFWIVTRNSFHFFYIPVNDNAS